MDAAAFENLTDPLDLNLAPLEIDGDLGARGGVQEPFSVPVIS